MTGYRTRTVGRGEEFPRHRLTGLEKADWPRRPVFVFVAPTETTFEVYVLGGAVNGAAGDR